MLCTALHLVWYTFERYAGKIAHSAVAPAFFGNQAGGIAPDHCPVGNARLLFEILALGIVERKGVKENHHFIIVLIDKKVLHGHQIVTVTAAVQRMQNIFSQSFIQTFAQISGVGTVVLQNFQRIENYCDFFRLRTV